MECDRSVETTSSLLTNGAYAVFSELEQLLLKCISITKYKLHFKKVIQILFSITLAMTGKIQNTKYIS